MAQDDWWFAASVALTLALMGAGFFVYVVNGYAWTPLASH
jgi:hypothetical protein